MRRAYKLLLVLLIGAGVAVLRWQRPRLGARVVGIDGDTDTLKLRVNVRQGGFGSRQVIQEVWDPVEETIGHSGKTHRGSDPIWVI